MPGIKNEWIAATASFFIAGWGHVCNGEGWTKGLLFFLGRFAGIALLLIMTLTGTFEQVLPFISQFPDPVLPGIFAAVFFVLPWILVAMYDASLAFSTARKINSGEIPYAEISGLRFWGYPVLIIISTSLIVVFGLSLGRA